MFPYYELYQSSRRASNGARLYEHAYDASCPPYESQSPSYWGEQHYTPNSYQEYHASHSYQTQYHDSQPQDSEPQPAINDMAKLMQAMQQYNAQLEAQVQAMQQTNDQHFANLRKAITGSQDQCEHYYGSLSNEVHHVPAAPPVHKFETQIPHHSLPLNFDKNSNHSSHLPQPSEQALPEDFEMTDEDWECPYDEWITKGYACLASLSNPVQTQQSEHASPEDFEMTEEDWESIDDEWVTKGFESFPPYIDEIPNNLSQEQESESDMLEFEEHLYTLKETSPAQQVEIMEDVVKIDTPTDFKDEPKFDVSINVMEYGTSTEDQHEDLKIGVPIRIDAPYEDVFLPLPLKPPDNFWSYMIPNIWRVRSDAHYFHIFKGRHLHTWFRSKLQLPIIFGGRLFQWDFKVD